MARICAAEAGGRTEGWPKKRTRLKMDRIFGPSCLLFGVPKTDCPAGSPPGGRGAFLWHTERFTRLRCAFTRHAYTVTCRAYPVTRLRCLVTYRTYIVIGRPEQRLRRGVPQNLPPAGRPSAAGQPRSLGTARPGWRVPCLARPVARLGRSVVRLASSSSRTGRKSPNSEKNRDKRYIKTVNKLGG